MADQLDTAAELAELHNQTAIQKHKRRLQNRINNNSSINCEECDELIPAARRQLILGVKFCIECQADYEAKDKQFFYN